MSLILISLYIAMTLLFLSLALILIRFIIGPDLPDRVIALDIFSANLLGILAIYSIISGVADYLDIALVLSMVTFIGTMTFAYYLVEKKNNK